MIFGGAAYGSVEYGGLVESVTPRIPFSRLRVIKVVWEDRELTVWRETRGFPVEAISHEFAVAGERRMMNVAWEERGFPVWHQTREFQVAATGHEFVIPAERVIKVSPQTREVSANEERQGIQVGPQTREFTQ